MSENLELDEVYARRKIWFAHYCRWQTVWWLILIIISGGSALVASAISEKLGCRDEIAMLVAVCSALLAVLRPETRSRACHEAWRDLDAAIKIQSGIPDALVQAINKGEGKIERGHFEIYQKHQPYKDDVSN